MVSKSSDQARQREDEDWTRPQKLVLALCALAIILDGFDTQVIGFAAPSLIADWGVSKADLAPVLGIGLFGMMIGAAVGGYIGDRFGRRAAIIGSLLMFGLSTGIMATASNLWELGILRLIAGLGLGSAFPSAAALVTEFTPFKKRSLAVSITIVCVPIGGVIGGLFAAPLLPVIGWRGLFLIAGVLPLLVAVVLILFLPESRSFLDARQLRLNGRVDIGAESQNIVRQDQVARGFFQTIAATGLKRDTFALCGAFTVGLLCNYLYFNWLPVLLSDARFAISSASAGLLVFNMGAVTSGIGVGFMTTRFGTRLPLSILAAGGAASAFILMFVRLDPQNSSWLMLSLALQGFCLGGTQILLYALAAHVFPVNIRATGVGIAASVGRIGAVISTTLGALVLLWGSFGFFLTIATAMAAGTFCILLVRRHDSRSSLPMRS